MLHRAEKIDVEEPFCASAFAQYATHIAGLIKQEHFASHERRRLDIAAMRLAELNQRVAPRQRHRSPRLGFKSKPTVYIHGDQQARPGEEMLRQ